MSSSDDESSAYSSSDGIEKPKTSFSPTLLQHYVGQKYAHLASLDSVRAIARKHGNKVHIIGDCKALSSDMRHAVNSLDTIIYKALNFVRNIDPEWDLQLIRFETISKRPQVVLPMDEYHRKLNKKEQWSRRFTSCEYIMIPHPKFTTYIAMDDSYKDARPPPMANPCEVFARAVEYEDPLPPNVFDEWVKNALMSKTAEEEVEDEEEVEEPDDQKAE